MIKRAFQKKVKTIALQMSGLILASTILLSPAMAQQVVIDNLSKTTVKTNGNVTDISTSTIKGKNAYNSFDILDVYKGNTVNLHVPAGADKLINLVHKKDTIIHGTLNGMVNGKIGGNIFLINPWGITVGAEGVINVGSLTAICPTREEMERIGLGEKTGLSEKGSNENFNNLSINQDAVIQIMGKVRASEDILMQAGVVFSTGTIEAGYDFNQGIDAVMKEDYDYNTPQSFNFADVVNLQLAESSHLQNAVMAANNAGSISLKGDIAVLLKDAVLKTKKDEYSGLGGKIKMDSNYGFIEGTGYFKGDIAAKSNNIKLFNYAGDLVIDGIDAGNGKVQLNTQDSILLSNDFDHNDAAILGNEVFLRAYRGDIGSYHKPVKISLNHNWYNKRSLTLKSPGGSVYAALNSYSDIPISKIETKNNLYLTSNKTILNANSTGDTLIGTNIVLNVEDGSIGTSFDPINIELSPYSKGIHNINLSAKASRDIYLRQIDDDMELNNINGRYVSIKAVRGNILDGRMAENPNLTAETIQLDSEYGNIGTKTEDLNITITDQNCGYLLATSGKYNGLVNIKNIEGDLRLKGASAQGKVILKSEGSIIDAEKSERPNVTSSYISLYSEKGSIGSLTDDLDIYAGNKASSSSKGILKAVAPQGSINIEQHFEDLYVEKVSAGKDVHIKTNFGIYSNQPGQNINIEADNVKLEAGKAIGTANDRLGVKAKGYLNTLSGNRSYIRSY